MQVKTNKLTPNLMVQDVKKTVAFYRETLGFELVMAVPADKNGIETGLQEDKDYIYALVKNQNTEIMFQETNSFKEDIPILDREKPGASASFYFEVEDVEGLAAHLKDRVETVKEIQTAWYGMREWYIKDNSGYILCLAQRV